MAVALDVIHRSRIENDNELFKFFLEECEGQFSDAMWILRLKVVGFLMTKTNKY